MPSAAAAASSPRPRSRVVLPRSWARRWIQFRASTAGLASLAVVIGVGAAIMAVAFRWLISTFTLLFSGYSDYAAHPGAANPNLPGLGRYFVVLAPAIAGLIYGPLIYRFAREARGHGMPEVMYAVARQGGRIRPQVAGVKALASALTIGGGGSVGREGPIVQIGAALGSTIGQLVKAPESRMRIFVACGAAAGIAATFNAPLAGVFFALELILMDFSSSSFGLVVISAVVSSIIGRAVVGNEVFLELPDFSVVHVQAYLLYALLGVVGGVLGVVFTRVLYAIEDLGDRLWRGPEWLRPGVGGLVLGLFLLALPQMYGVGYPVLGNAVLGRYALGFLLVLMIGKMLATSLTLAIGGSGGVFAPSLFIGATGGAAFGVVANQLFPTIAGPVGIYALLGMGAVFAGAVRAPMTGVIVLFELTNEYSIILPLMTAVVIGTVVSSRLSSETIYTLKLRRRGVDLSGPARQPASPRTAIDRVMRPLPAPIEMTMPLSRVATRLGRSAYGVLPVVDSDGKFLGIVTARAVADALAAGYDLAEDADVIANFPVRVYQGDALESAVNALDRVGAGGVPVWPREGKGDPIGWVTYRDVLRAPELAAATGAEKPAPTSGDRRSRASTDS